MRYALLVHDSGLSRVLSCTNQRVWPVTHDSSFDDPEQNGKEGARKLVPQPGLRGLEYDQVRGLSTRCQERHPD